MSKLSKAQAELADSRAEARRQADMLRVTQTSLEECRAMLAQLREEKTALLLRVGRPSDSAYSDAALTSSTALARLSSKTSDELQAQLQQAKYEVQSVREGIDDAKRRLSVGGGDGSSTAIARRASPTKPTPSTMLRVENGTVKIGDGVASIQPGLFGPGSTIFHSDTGATVQITKRDGQDGLRLDVVPAPGRAPSFIAGTPGTVPALTTPGIRPITPKQPDTDDSSSVGATSTRSGFSPSPGAQRLQERLKRVQETFAQLRSTAV